MNGMIWVVEKWSNNAGWKMFDVAPTRKNAREKAKRCRAWGNSLDKVRIRRYFRVIETKRKQHEYTN